MTLGSRSTKRALGTCLPVPVEEKKVEKESSNSPEVSCSIIIPSGPIPCSRQYNSLQFWYQRTESWDLLTRSNLKGHNLEFFNLFFWKLVAPWHGGRPQCNHYQQAFPIWQPAWPTWMLMTSLIAGAYTDYWLTYTSPVVSRSIVLAWKKLLEKVLTTLRRIFNCLLLN